MSYVSRNSQSIHMYIHAVCIPLSRMPTQRCNGRLSRVLFTYKGKEYLFVEETKTNLETLQCPVCFGIVLEPVQTSCGHLFCKKCVEGVTISVHQSVIR